MSYNLTLTNGTVLVAGGLPDGTIDSTTTSIGLIGRNVASYGTTFNENFIKILENFSNTTAPLAPLTGQLWWNSTSGVLEVYNGAGWKVIQSSTSSATAPTNVQSGDFWWNTTLGALEVYTGAGWVVIGPTIAVGSPVTTFAGYSVLDNTAIVHNLGNIVVNSNTIAVTSKDATFTLATPQLGLTKINPGINFTSTVESSMISSPNMTMGVTNGNVQISGTSTGTGILFVANLSGTVSNVLYISGTTGLGLLYADPTANLGISTKQYVDSSVLTSNTTMAGYVTSSITTSNSSMKTYVDAANTSVTTNVTQSNVRMTTYVNAQVANLSSQISGLGVGGLVINGVTTSVGNLVANSGTASTNTTTGALVVLGGAGVSGNVFVGGNISANAFTPTATTIVPTTGFFSNAANTIGISTNSNVAAYVNSASQVGIGMYPIPLNGVLQVNGYASIKALLETATIVGTFPSSLTNFDVMSQAVAFYTSNAIQNFTFNIRGNSGNQLNSIMQVGQSATIALLVSNLSATPFYPNVIQIDGTNVTPKWQGGSAPTGGNANSIDVYVFTVIKTANATYTVLASQTKFA